MKNFYARFATNLYYPELHYLHDFGDHVDVREQHTLEKLNVISEIREPQHHCILIPARRWNPWLALSESLWILAGRNDVATLLPYNSHIGDYSDDGDTLYGAYGLRMADQIDDLIGRLERDHNDRRAVLQIWNSSGWNDLVAVTKDPPCNNMVYFKIRDSSLHMTVMCRSNDLHFGLFAVNIPTFGLLQEYIAARLGVHMGTQTHISNSLHIYTGRVDPGPRADAITKRMLEEEDVEHLVLYPQHEMAFHDLTKWIGGHNNFSAWCGMVLDDMTLGNNSLPFFQFSQAFLKQYREHEWHPQDLPFKDEFGDWVLAGQNFVDRMWK